MASIKPFKVSIPDSELDLLRRKLELTRLPKYDFEWTEENGLTVERTREILHFWLNDYDWRSEEARINKLPQFITQIEVDDGYGTLDVHFVHSLSSSSSPPSPSSPKSGRQGGNTPTATPLLFLHGWPGSFIEVEKGLHLLNRAGFDVVAPSLPGYGFSSYSKKKGFSHRQHAEVMNKLMIKLGHTQYVAQGGDWGSAIVHAIGILYPKNVLAVHQNMLQTPKFDWPPKDPSIYTKAELANLERAYLYFLGPNNAYSQIFAQRPLTTGWSLHDSPIGLLCNFADKLITWSDAYPWTPTELITWTLLHWFSTAGPTAGLAMYHENNPPACMIQGTWATKYVDVPCGYSAFPKEIIMPPKSWADRMSNCVFYRNHDRGGHFAMYEVPDVLVGDMLEFYAIALKNTKYALDATDNADTTVELDSGISKL